MSTATNPKPAIVTEFNGPAKLSADQIRAVSLWLVATAEAVDTVNAASRPTGKSERPEFQREPRPASEFF